MEDIILSSDGWGWLMTAGSEAGEAFVREHSSPTPDSRVRGAISLGAAAYAQVIADAKAAGLTVVQR